jgi:hypothetical protein
MSRTLRRSMMRLCASAPSIDYRPIIAVIAIVVFSLGMIAFLLSLRMK